MNINVLIDKLKKDIGLNGPLGNAYSDTIIRDSIINNSLKTFNRVSGFNFIFNIEQVMTIWVRQPAGNPYLNNDMVFRIPDMYMDRFRELGVEIKKIYMNGSGANGYGVTAGSTRGLKDELPSWTAKAVRRANTQDPQLTFRPPSSIILKNMGSYITPMYGGYYKIYMECTHPNNLSTITIGLENWFEDLCRYDLMINLYNNDLRNLKIEIGSGSVDLNLENFQNAESDRKTLLEQIRTRANVDQIILNGQ